LTFPPTGFAALGRVLRHLGRGLLSHAAYTSQQHDNCKSDPNGSESFCAHSSPPQGDAAQFLGSIYPTPIVRREQAFAGVLIFPLHLGKVAARFKPCTVKQAPAIASTHHIKRDLVKGNPGTGRTQK